MAIELRHDQATALVLDAPDGIVATSATLTLYKPNGQVVEAPAVTVPTASTTVQAGSTDLDLVLASVAGLSPGQLVRITSHGVHHLRRIASISGTTVQLLSALPEDAAAADVVKSLRLAATFAAPGASLLGANYSAEWTWTDGTNKGSKRESVDVVRWPFVNPVGPQDVADILAQVYRDTSRPEAWCADIAGRAAEKIRLQLWARGERPHLYVDSGRFREAALTAVHWLLAESGYSPAGTDAETRQRNLRIQFAEEVALVVRSLAVYDGDGDGQAGGDQETARHFYSFAASR